ncbi:unnamed protein product [Adineta ricciae]|uniref:G-protein coupled receptors family 1 profile domain-containing protein n=1 Tax=Adineta ricciae TaxID=249248 RepID=A0A816A0L3_ADIRI|nr:unnamed protein product [Adineta ricciae]
MNTMPRNFSSLEINDEIDKSVSDIWIQIEFFLFLMGQIFAIPCYLFVMYHILAHRTARRALHNHVIIMILLYCFLDLIIDLSLTMSYSLSKSVPLFSPILCLTWQFVDYGIWYGSISLMLWASIERHILVFHTKLVRTSQRRLLFHYIPLIFFSLYTPTLYFYLIFIYPCHMAYDDKTIRCGSLCYLKSAPIWFFYYDILTHYVVPVLLVAVFSAILILRFLKQRSRLKRATKWRQCRKMIIQLGLVSISYIVFDLPYIIIVIVQSSGHPEFGHKILSPYISHMVYVPAIIVPYAILLSLPRLKQKLRVLLFWKRTRRIISPMTIIQ